jgi:hypothetical protein
VTTHAIGEARAEGLHLWRMPLEKYLAMIEAGIITEDDRVELLHGVLFEKMTKNDPHIIAQMLLNPLLIRLLPPGWQVNIENPITIGDSAPEPNLAIIRGDARGLMNRAKSPETVAVVIEISDSTLDTDRLTKRSVYAQGKIPIYWFVNLVEHQVEVYSDPFGDGNEADYRTGQIYASGTSGPLVLDGQEIARLSIADILP